MKRDNMLQIVRIPVLLVLLWPLAAVSQRMTRYVETIDVAGAVTSGVWPLVVAVSLLFVIVAVAGRGERHAPGVLLVEGVIAGGLALVPPVAWMQWFGFAPVPGVGPVLVIAAVEGLLHPFAIMWLAIVLWTAVRQWQQARERSAASEVTKTR
jgi:hypothetical protein